MQLADQARGAACISVYIDAWVTEAVVLLCRLSGRGAHGPWNRGMAGDVENNGMRVMSPAVAQTPHASEGGTLVLRLAIQWARGDCLANGGESHDPAGDRQGSTLSAGCCAPFASWTRSTDRDSATIRPLRAVLTLHKSVSRWTQTAGRRASDSHTFDGWAPTVEWRLWACNHGRARQQMWRWVKVA